MYCRIVEVTFLYCNVTVDCRASIFRTSAWPAKSSGSTAVWYNPALPRLHWRFAFLITVASIHLRCRL